MRLTRELEPVDVAEWARSCAQALAAGDRLMTLFGRRATDDQVITTAVLQGAHGLDVLRGQGRRGQSYPSLTIEQHCATGIPG
jgi:hypothetical protein